MVRGIDSASTQTTGTSSFGIPLSTTSDRDGRLTRWRMRRDEPQSPGWRRTTIIMLSLYLCTIIVSLDRTILGTAIPTITNEFHSLEDVGWYASAYLLTSCATQLIFGKIYKFYNYKWVLMMAIAIFEVGSAVCGSAPNSKVFIIGRAIAGLGSAGIFNGTILIMAESVPLHRRPIFMGIFGAVFAISSVCGPLLGGALTTQVNWRWCFYINLPIGGAVAFILFFIVKGKRSRNRDTFREKLQKMDRLGTLVFIPGIICILLALQWGGHVYSWRNARIIFLFILGGALLTFFMFIQFRAGENATVPIRILKQRSIASAVWFSFFNSGAMYTIVYYIPIWFQAIQGLDAITSGIHTIPLVLALVFANLFAGLFTRACGYYVPMVICSSIVATVGAGLLTTLQPYNGPKEWMSWQVVFGWGLGLGMQQANLAVQACLPPDDVSTGLALMFFSQGLGGTIFVTVGQLIFQSALVREISGLDIPSLPASVILHSGATEIRTTVPLQYLQSVLLAYNDAITTTFRAAIVTCAVTIVAGLAMEWKNVNAMGRARQAGDASDDIVEEGSIHSVADEELPDLVHHAKNEERTHDGRTDQVVEDKKEFDATAKRLAELTQQQLETIREEREKSTSADTGGEKIERGGVGGGGLVEKAGQDDDEIRVVG